MFFLHADPKVSKDFFEFETEIKNILVNSFQYNLTLTEAQNKGLISLPSRPHEELWEDLIANNYLEPIHVDPSQSESDLQTLVTEFLEEKRPINKLILKWKRLKEDQTKHAEKLSSLIYDKRCGLTKYETPDSSLKPIQEYLNLNDKFKKRSDIQQFSSNGFGDVIVLEEQR